MFRYVNLTIPAATPESAPETKLIKLRHGRITHWWIGFPPGCCDLVHVAIYHYEYRVIPRDEKESVYWNNYVFDIPDSYDFTEEPYEIEVRAWNNDDIYEHIITVGVEVEEIEEVTMKELLSQFLKSLVGVS